MEYTMKLGIDEESSSTIVQNIHESFRMLGDALLVYKGVDPKTQTTHVESIYELMKLKIKTTRPLQLIDNIRTLRRNVNYYGYLPSIVETEDVVNIAKDLFNPLYVELKKILK
jgi:hypothetical protein